MTQAHAVVEPFAFSTLWRRRAGAVGLMVGALPVALMVLADASPYLFLLAIGAIATCAWLVDGRRTWAREPWRSASGLDWCSPETSN